jgi:PAS domain S-box-containing protein
MAAQVNETAEIAVLRAQLAEAEAVLDAIRSGAADAFIGEAGGVFHLKGAEKPYVTFFDEMNEGGVTLDISGNILHGNPCFAAMTGRPIEALRGESFCACIAPESHVRVAELLASQSTSSCEAFLNASRGPLLVGLSLKVASAGVQQFRCLVVTDLSARAIAESELRAAMASQRETDAQLRQRERDLRSVLDHVPSMIGYWGKDLCNRFGNHAYKHWFGIDPDQMVGRHIREVIGEERYRLNLPYIEAALRGERQVFERAFPVPDGSVVRYSLSHYIPDVVEGEVHGFYALVTDITPIKEGEAAIRRSEEQLRAMYANLQSVVEAERKHVAREVHDELGQILTALRMETSLLQRELAGNDKAQERIGEMRLLTESMFKTVRSIAGSLRPSTLDLGLVSAIEWLAEDFEKRWKIECVLDIDPREIAASDAYATTVFRVIQESLTNVARHANASRVSIWLRQSADRMRLEVRDNGCGLPDDNSRLGGFGLIGMKERVVELGGALTLQSQAGQGVGILIDLPWAPTEENDSHTGR